MRWLTLLVTAFVLIASGCGGSDDESAASDETTIEETVTEENAAESTTDCRVPAYAAAAMYVGWAIWEDFGFVDGDPPTSGGAHTVPDEIKADVETLAQALVKYSATFSDEDLGFPLEDLGIPPGDAPLDNDLARFDYAIDSMDREARTLQHLDAWAQENCTG